MLLWNGHGDVLPVGGTRDDHFCVVSLKLQPNSCFLGRAGRSDCPAEQENGVQVPSLPALEGSSRPAVGESQSLEHSEKADRSVARDTSQETYGNLWNL